MLRDALSLLVVPGDLPVHLNDQLGVGQRLAKRLMQIALGLPGLELAAPDGRYNDKPRAQKSLNGVPERPRS